MEYFSNFFNLKRNVWTTDEELIKCLKSLDGTDLIYYFVELLESVLTYVVNNMDKFNPDDWCYIYYLIYKYVVKENENSE